MNRKTSAVFVLYVEDEESDAFFMHRAFKQVAPEVRLRTVTDGQQALDYLAGRNGYGDRAEHPVPALVLVDLKLKVLQGFEVLKWIREQPQYKSLPVVVFSSSAYGQDKMEADEWGADWYLEKPDSESGFREIVEELKRRWFSGSGGAAVIGGDAGTPAIRMRKLVQDKATKAFLTHGGKWVKDWRRAEVFATTEAARAAILAHNIHNVELYYLFGEEISGFDFTVCLSL